MECNLHRNILSYSKQNWRTIFRTNLKGMKNQFEILYHRHETRPPRLTLPSSFNNKIKSAQKEILKIINSAFSIPHKDKREKGGEDAYFTYNE
jgi:hypothetical protein